jgi:alpha-methylacyl-CoA racemase
MALCETGGPRLAGGLAAAVTVGGGPLAGVRVVEIAGGGSLPLTGMLLSDMGAQVTRVERIGSDRLELGPQAALRGRRSILLDLSRPAGVEVVHRLCADSDALVEGFRPGTA